MDRQTPPDKPDGDGGMPGGEPGGAPGGDSGSVSYSGATEINSNTTLDGTSYASSNGSENALLVSGGEVTINNISVEKTGDADGDNSDFYGTNAAVLAYNGGILNINGGSVTTNGSHANAVFAYGEGTINISDVKIVTSSNNSGGVMVTGGGTLNATGLSVATSGNSSAAIRSDRGGGTMKISGGNYVTSGTGSPVIYSTADILVTGATLTAAASEGVVIEGKNSVTLTDTILTDTNNTLNGNSETYKNVFIYQSMSGDASEGTGNFTAKHSQLTTNQGDDFFITNTTAIINLTNNKFVNNDGAGIFLRAQSGKWGNSGSNGGDVTLNAENQEIIGDITVDAISSINLNLSNSYYKGVIGGDGAKNVALSGNTVYVLNGDTVLSSLTNDNSENDNIYANGYTLTVDGATVAINEGEAPESHIIFNEIETSDSTNMGDDIDCESADANCVQQTETSYAPLIIGGCVVGFVLLALVFGLIVFVKTKKKKQADPNTQV